MFIASNKNHVFGLVYSKTAKLSGWKGKEGRSSISENISNYIESGAVEIGEDTELTGVYHGREISLTYISRRIEFIRRRNS